MPKNMLIHDTRLCGSTPTGLAQNNYIVDGSTPTTHIFEWADYYAHTQQGLDNLFIFCHGNSAYLQLGNTGVNLGSSILFSIFSGDVRNIIILACLVASGTNGPIFCSKVATMSGATVTASDTEQLYYHDWLSAGRINFGGWEGRVFQFFPNGMYADITPVAPDMSN